MAQPPTQVKPGNTRRGERNIAVNADDAEVTAFSADNVRALPGRLRTEYDS